MTPNGLRLGVEFFNDGVEDVARRLVGADLFTNVDGICVQGKIIATESYEQDDPFSHCYNGPGSAVRVGAEQMGGPPGTIYFAENNLGCTFNISCGPVGCFSAVLICMLLPFCSSTAVMRGRRRSYKNYRRALDDDDKYMSYLCNGPQNLCDSLGISEELYRLSHTGALTVEDSRFGVFATGKDYRVQTGPRIGLDKQQKGFSRARSTHPFIEKHRLAHRRFTLERFDKLLPCIASPDAA